ncbi:MAG: PAS domain S-box protein [Rubrobacteraceae bacterium]
MWRDLCVAHGVLACHSTPVPSADRRPLGSFMLCFNEAREPNEWERRLSEFGAHVASIAIERDRVELALRESERRFREMVDALPSAIYTTDAEGRLTHFNPAAVEFSGRVPELGTDHWCVSWKLYHPDGTLMPHDECPMAISLKEGRAVRGAEAIAERPDGERIWFAAYPTPLRDSEGRVVGGINMLMDVTGRKQAEGERERFQALEVVARAQAAERVRISRELHDRVAHDMAVVHQDLQLHEALRENDPERAEAKLDAAREMVRSALDATRDLSSELRRPASEGGLEKALRELVETYVPAGVSTELSFDGDESSIPEHVRGQFYLILREAIRNAVKHSGCHHLTVEIEALPGKVFGSVGDDGRGFDMDGDHDGVGLESMRERAELLNGDLYLVPGPGGGTRMEISVPLVESTEER